MPTDDLDILRDAVVRNGAAVVSLPSDGFLKHCKTRFVAADDLGLWIALPPGEQTRVGNLMSTKQEVGVAFRSGLDRLVFGAVVRQIVPRLPISKTLSVDAIHIHWPAQLVRIRRRVAYRVTVDSFSDVQVRTWKIADAHILRDRPAASTEIKGCQLKNLSVGGMALGYIPHGPEMIIHPDQRLRVQITYPQGEILMDARVKHAKLNPDDQNLMLGVEFRQQANDFDGRRATSVLTQIVGHLQQLETKRLTGKRSA